LEGSPQEAIGSVSALIDIASSRILRMMTPCKLTLSGKGVVVRGFGHEFDVN
jgi:hypothetical protein